MKKRESQLRIARELLKVAKDLLATRPIRIDRRVVEQSLDRLIDFLKRQPDKPLGSSLAFADSVTIQDVQGKDMVVEVQYRSKPGGKVFDMVLGGGSGKTNKTKRPAAMLLVNGIYKPKDFASSDSDFRHEAMTALMHELTHNADIYAKPFGPATQRVLKEDEIDLQDYYNRPSEVRAYMREMVEDVFRDLPEFLKKFKKNEAVARLVKLSPTWERIKPYLNERNKGLVLKGVYQAVEDSLVAEENARTGMKRAARQLVAEIPEPPPQMMQAIAEWALGHVAANNALFYKRETELYAKLLAEEGEADELAGHYKEMLAKSQERLRESLLMAKRYGAPLTAWRQISKRFKIDLGGWRYESLIREAPNRDEANSKFDNLLIVLNDQHVRESWYLSGKNEMRVFTFHKRPDEIEDAIEHELLHWAQHYAQQALKSDWGLPSERNLDIHQGQKQKGSHSLDDAEFYAELIELTRRIKRLSKSTGDDIESVANSMLGIGNPLPDAKPPKFILEIKEMAPKKWSLAVKEVFDNIRSSARAASRTASLKTWGEIRDEQDPGGKGHDLRLTCDVCGNVETCRCSKPKREFHGICYDCAEKGRTAGKEVRRFFKFQYTRSTKDKIKRVIEEGSGFALKRVYMHANGVDNVLEIDTDAPYDDLDFEVDSMSSPFRSLRGKPSVTGSGITIESFENIYGPLGRPKSQVEKRLAYKGKLAMASRYCRLKSASQRVGAFSVTDNLGLEPLEMEAMEGALSLVEKTLSAAGLGKFARGDIEVGDYGSFWAAQYKKSSDVILLNAPRLLIRSGKIPRFVALKSLYHEIGHRVFDSLPVQWQAWYEFEFDAKGRKSVTSYGSTKAQEDFAEIFAAKCLDKPIPSDMMDRFDTVVSEARAS